MRIIRTRHRLALGALSLGLGLVGVSADASVRIRDGRQIYLALTTAVGLREDRSVLNSTLRFWDEQTQLAPVAVTFRETLSGLPEFGSVAELAPSLPSILRLISSVCELHARRVTYIDYFGVSSQELPRDERFVNLLNTRIQQDKGSRNRYRPPQLAKMVKIATENSYRLILRRSPTAAEEAAVLAALDPQDGRAQNVLEAHALACGQSAATMEFLEVPPRRQAGRGMSR